MCDKAQSDSKLNVFGKQIEQVLGTGGSNTSGTTKVFASQSLTDQDIISYAQSLAGDVLLEERKTPLGVIYIAKKEGRPTINLRNFSSSKEKTEARWTIDIINNEDVIKSTGKTSIDKVEIKFR